MIKKDDTVRWKYNCFDIKYTLEIAEKLEDIISNLPEKRKSFYHFQQDCLTPAMTEVMRKGILVELEQKNALFEKFSKLALEVEKKISFLIGEPYNSNSIVQNKRVILDLLEIEPILSKESRNPSFSFEVFTKYKEEYPEYRVFFQVVLEYRSLSVFIRTFLAAEVDDDGKMRCFYNISGTETYRLSSSKNIHGKGCNLQTLPSKGKLDLMYSTEEVENLELPAEEFYRYLMEKDNE